MGRLRYRVPAKCPRPFSIMITPRGYANQTNRLDTNALPRI